MISSTHGNGIDRKTFDEELEKRNFLVADKYSPKRISIGIKSFTRGAVHLEDETMCLSLLEKFDGRNLKNGYDWNNDIYPKLRGFLIANTNNKHAYQVFLDTHASLAFAAGQVLDSKSGINVFPIQKSATNGTELRNQKLSSKRNYSNWDISHEMFDENQFVISPLSSRQVKKLNIAFSKVKVAFDISMVLISVITCLIVLHSFGSVGIGTIIAAFLVGIVL